MMFMTAKVDFKKIGLVLVILAAVITCLVLLFSGDSTPSAEPAGIAENDGRVRFLSECGWEVAPEPAQSGEVRIPGNPGEVFLRYNDLQKTQGYDLTRYGDRNVMRYVYEVRNYPGASEPVYATLLIYKDQVIGGDVTDTSPNGRVQGLRSTSSPQTPTEPQSPAVSEPSAVTGPSAASEPAS